MRAAEIIPSRSSGEGAAPSSRPHRRERPVAWLSSEMEESFLATPSFTAGEESNGGEMRLLSVISTATRGGEGPAGRRVLAHRQAAGTASAAGADNNAMDARTARSTPKRLAEPRPDKDALQGAPASFPDDVPQPLHEDEGG